jgi:hypothetical protein
MNEKRLLGSWLIASIFIIGLMGYQIFVLHQSNTRLVAENKTLVSDVQAKDRVIQKIQAEFQAHQNRELTELKKLTRRAAEFGWVARGKKDMTINDMYDILDRK